MDKIFYRYPLVFGSIGIYRQFQFVRGFVINVDFTIHACCQKTGAKHNRTILHLSWEQVNHSPREHISIILTIDIKRIGYFSFFLKINASAVYYIVCPISESICGNKSNKRSILAINISQWIRILCADLIWMRSLIHRLLFGICLNLQSIKRLSNCMNLSKSKCSW